MLIFNNREDQDYARLNQKFWSGIEQGNHDYPHRDNEGNYLIAGGRKDSNFKTIAIEFYGVKYNN